MSTTKDELFGALFENQDPEPIHDDGFKSSSIDNSVLELVEAYNKLKDENESILEVNDGLCDALREAYDQIDKLKDEIQSDNTLIENLQQSLDEADEVIDALNEEIDCKNDTITDISKKYNKLLYAIKKSIV